MIKCPVCGNDVRFYDICENCGYENTNEVNIDGGQNIVTLKEAIENHKDFGISDPNDDYCKFILKEGNEFKKIL